ncbi:MAG: ABC transporter permease [Candidatus Dormibacteria bacterium]
MELIRNLFRRKLRNSLTIGGIAIGVLALATLGALAEKNNKLIDGGVRYFSGHVGVSDATANGFGGGGFLNQATVDRIKHVDGVQAAFSAITLPAKGDRTISFGASDSIVAEEAGAAKYEAFKLTAREGKRPDQLQDGEVAMGSDIATELKVRLGDSIDLPTPPKQYQSTFRNHPFRVVGIMDKTLTAPDNFAYITLHDGRRGLGDNLPPALRGQVNTSDLVNSVNVYGKPGVNLDKLAVKINNEVPGVKAQSPTELVNAFKSFSTVFSAITIGSALIALVVGGLSVINTMLMSVTERYREIGLKKAVGARTRHILQEFVSEAILIGVIGGCIGLGLGALLTTVINAATASSNLQLFLLTPSLAIGSLLFSVGLGAVAGLIPALRAARLDPVTALRSQ